MSVLWQVKYYCQIWIQLANFLNFYYLNLKSFFFFFSQKLTSWMQYNTYGEIFWWLGLLAWCSPNLDSSSLTWYLILFWKLGEGIQKLNLKICLQNKNPHRQPIRLVKSIQHKIETTLNIERHEDIFHRL